MSDQDRPPPTGPLAHADVSNQDTGEGTVVVPPQQGAEHGYIGRRPRTEPNSAYTVAGVTGGTATVADTPTGSADEVRTAWKPLQR